MSQPLRGKRALVLEDSALVAMELEDFLLGLGASSVGCYATSAEAARSIEHKSVDLALCDVNLRDGSSLALVDELRGRGVRCVLLTGYAEIPDGGAQVESVPVLRKPVSHADLERVLREVVASGAADR